MYISGNTTLGSFHTLESSDVQLFTDYCNLINQCFLYRLGSILTPCLFQQCIHIVRRRANSLFCNSLHELLESLILCHKVSFGIYFYHCRLCISIGSNATDPLCRNSALLLHCLSLSLFAQDLHSLFHISIGLTQSLLTICHTGAGLFTQFLNHSRCNCCHLLYPPNSY